MSHRTRRSRLVPVAFPLVAFALGACASRGSVPADDARTAPPAATFVTTDEVAIEPSEDAPLATVRSCLSTKPTATGALAYGLEFSFAFGHQCTMSGEAQPTGSNVWVDSDHGNDCRLTFTWDGAAWALSDPDGKCRVENCGARGHLELGFRQDERADYDASCGQ